MVILVPSRWGGSKMRSKLIKLEREISRLTANRTERLSTGHPMTNKGRPSVSAGNIKTTKKRLTASQKGRERTFLMLLRTLLSAIRGISVPANARQWKASASTEHAGYLARRTSGRTRSITGILFAVSFGLFAMLSILSVLLTMKVKDIEKQIAQSRQELAVMTSQLAIAEKKIQHITSNGSNSAATNKSVSLSLTDADKKLIRQFITFLPPEPGAKQKIHLGDKIADTALASVPDALVDELPKLRGARFLVDQDGTIVISAQGSDRANALIAYRQPH